MTIQLYRTPEEIQQVMDEADAEQKSNLLSPIGGRIDIRASRDGELV